MPLTRTITILADTLCLAIDIMHYSGITSGCWLGLLFQGITTLLSLTTVQGRVACKTVIPLVLQEVLNLLRKKEVYEV
jgi:hypothetical protein